MIFITYLVRSFHPVIKLLHGSSNTQVVSARNIYWDKLRENLHGVWCTVPLKQKNWLINDILQLIAWTWTVYEKMSAIKLASLEWELGILFKKMKFDIRFIKLKIREYVKWFHMAMNNINQYTVWMFLRNYIINLSSAQTFPVWWHHWTVSTCAIAESPNYAHYIHPDLKLLPYSCSLLQHFLNTFSGVRTGIV